MADPLLNPDEETGVRLVGSLRHKEVRDRSQDAPPRPGFVSDAPDSNVLELPGVKLRVVGGAAMIEDGDETVFDFSGRDSSKDPAHIGETGFHANLALDPRMPLPSIANNILERIQAYKDARLEWEEVGEKGADLLGVKWEEPSGERGGEGFISKAHHPMLLEAILRAWASGRSELLPSRGPVKVADDMPPEPEPGLGHNGGPPLDDMDAGGGGEGIAGQGAAAMAPPERASARDKKADALEKAINHYLTVIDKEYYPDFSRMLTTRALKGSQFRKVYFDPLLKRPVSRWVKGTDLILSNDAAHLSRAGCIAERIEVRQATAKRMMRAKAWRDVQLQAPMPQTSRTEQSNRTREGIAAVPSLPSDYPHEIYEVYIELDDGPLAFDENGKDQGIPLPYKVTVENYGREVLEIRRDWEEGDEDFRPLQHYVHYGFLPGLGFYSWGYLHVLGSPEKAATAMLREFIDAEMMASMPSGFQQKGPATRGDTTSYRLGPSEFGVVDTGGVPIAEFMQVNPFKGANPGLPAALQHVVTEARRIAGSLEMPVGEGRVGDVPVQTIMAYIDAVSKVPSAIHKDDHMAQQEEYLLLKKLLCEHPEALQCKRHPKRWTREEFEDCDLVPAADPNTPSQTHRIMRAAARVQLSGMPQYQGIADQRAVYQESLRTLGDEDPDQFTLPQQTQQTQAPPDPRVLEALGKQQLGQQKLDVDKQKLALQQQENQREAAAQSVEAEQRQADRESEESIEQMRQNTERMRAQEEAARAHREHALDVTDRTMQHHREVGSIVAEHARHRETLEQEDRHHADEMEQQRRQGIKKPGEGGEK